MALKWERSVYVVPSLVIGVPIDIAPRRNLEMAIDNNNSDDNDPVEVSTDNSATMVQKPVRLTIGHYYCANCGEDPLSRSDSKCPRCKNELRWDGVAL